MVYIFPISAQKSRRAKFPQNLGNTWFVCLTSATCHPIEALRQWRALWKLSLLAIKLFGFSENNLARPNLGKTKFSQKKEGNQVSSSVFRPIETKLFGFS